MINDSLFGKVLMVALLASVCFGSLFWTVRFANAWDSRVGKMVAQIDVLIEKAYGAATSQ